MEEEQRHKKLPKQGTLNLSVVKLLGPQVFTCENPLHVITQFITIDDQVRIIVESCQICLTSPLVTCSHKQSDVSKLFSCDVAEIDVG